MPLPIDREEGKRLFKQYYSKRDGIRNCPEMASICLICGSLHVVPDEDDDLMLACFNCGFAFYRYTCPACGQTIDGRDPANPGCDECGQRICTCGACGCPDSKQEVTP